MQILDLLRLHVGRKKVNDVFQIERLDILCSSERDRMTLLHLDSDRPEFTTIQGWRSPHSSVVSRPVAILKRRQY